MTDTPKLEAPAKRHDNPARDLLVASLTDPAFDHAHPTWREASARYGETRAVADLAALPVIPGQLPTLWRVRPLSIAARASVLGTSSVAVQRLFALRFGLVERLDGAAVQANGNPVGGTTTALATVDGAAIAQTRDEAIQAAADEWGGVWLDEIADVILHRMDLPPRRYFPFPLPLPSALLT